MQLRDAVPLEKQGKNEKISRVADRPVYFLKCLERFSFLQNVFWFLIWNLNVCSFLPFGDWTQIWERKNSILFLKFVWRKKIWNMFLFQMWSFCNTRMMFAVYSPLCGDQSGIRENCRNDIIHYNTTIQYNHPIQSSIEMQSSITIIH